MRPLTLNIIGGYFLPVPPIRGGAMEKVWSRVAVLAAARGHRVRYFSRRWAGWPDRENRDGVEHHRLPGSNHGESRLLNVWRDLLWARRVIGALPAADITVVNSPTLPARLPGAAPQAGAVVAHVARMPRGQCRYFGRVARIMAPSQEVATRVAAENPALAKRTRVQGLPIDGALLRETAERDRPVRGDGPLTIGFAGRVHPEKGLDVLASAAAQLAAIKELPEWRLAICGPVTVQAGGAGKSYAEAVRARMRESVGETRIAWHEPLFDASALAHMYAWLDVFCYPSIAERGETFGVAVAEAMAAGAVPVVSDLACFRDFVRQGDTGLVFDHRSSDPAGSLASALRHALEDKSLRSRLASSAREEVRRFDYEAWTGEVLADFQTLAASHAS